MYYAVYGIWSRAFKYQDPKGPGTKPGSIRPQLLDLPWFMGPYTIMFVLGPSGRRILSSSVKTQDKEDSRNRGL